MNQSEQLTREPRVLRGRIVDDVICILIMLSVAVLLVSGPRSDGMSEGQRRGEERIRETTNSESSAEGSLVPNQH